MKTFLTLLLLAAMTLPARAQTYHPLVESGKVWSTVHYYSPGTVAFSDYTRFQGDTTINGLVYKMVWKSVNESQSDWTANGYIREDGSGHVYYKTWAGGSPNNLIYDFGASTGDTIYLFDDPMGSYFIVDSVDTVTLLTGEPRKRFNLSCFMAGGGPFGQETWIEGMGSLFGVLQSGSCILVGDNPQLLCFREHDTLKYSNPGYSVCFVITGTEPPLKGRLAADLFPNPADKCITIRVNEPASLPVTAEFRDPAGRVILRRHLTDRQTIIDLGVLPSAPVILYTLRGKDGSFTCGKIIVLKDPPSR